MKFDPKSDGLNCAPEGNYSASIDKIVEGVSKTSNDPMYVIILTVYHGEQQLALKDYVPMPSASPKKFLWKFKRIAQACGKESVWETGDLDKVIEAVTGANVTVALGVKSSPQYGDSNTIDGYSPMTRQGTTQAVVGEKKAAGVTITEEDIPF